PEKKRPLPENISKIGVISSTQAAGYADFIKILNERWGGLKVKVAHTQVQGLPAADQIIRALTYLNETEDLDIIAIIRGGGSADDLSVFNDEQLVRAIARSKIPVITGIGHEVDETLSDLAADIRASTPSNVAQLITPSREAQVSSLHRTITRLSSVITGHIYVASQNNQRKITSLHQSISLQITKSLSDISSKIRLLDRLNPSKVLAQGYALVKGELTVGNVVKITTSTHSATAKIETVDPLPPPKIQT
ncbi:exodeoxyribonuclease VII large subunit, partial [Candidatus Saccharibacteria bacterium]|nr:exodeoxyribonuclease VII large subunit [Candidatus Saccharibacteria bacterium]